MKIDNVTFQDEGKYSCKFPNDPHLNKAFTVTIECEDFF